MPSYRGARKCLRFGGGLEDASPPPVAATLVTEGMTFTATIPGSAMNGIGIFGGVFFADNAEAAWFEVGFPVFQYSCATETSSATPATGSIGPLTVFYRYPDAGAFGEGYSIFYVYPEPDAFGNAAAIGEEDSASLQIIIGTDGGGVVNTTYTELQDLIHADSNYIDASGSGAATVTDWVEEILEGGADPVSLSTEAEIIAAISPSILDVFTGVTSTPSNVPQSFGGLFSGGSD